MDPISEASNTSDSPREPHIDRCRSEDQVSSSESVLIGDHSLSTQYGHSQVPVSAFNRVIFALRSVPSHDVFIAFSESNVTKAKPEEESTNGEPMLGRDQESIKDEETS